MLKVAVAVIQNKAKQILISQRADHVHQAGLWEFPGGKLEAGENTPQALTRELYEELGISVISAEPFLQIKHQYDELVVFLDVYWVDDFKGEAQGMEGQPIQWIDQAELVKFCFPAANKRIIDTLLLPDCYPIVDECLGDAEVMLAQLEHLIESGYQMIQLRAKSFPADEFKALVTKALVFCEGSDVRLFVNTSVQNAIELNLQAVHLSAVEFADGQALLPEGLDVAVSCHNQDELQKAVEGGALFAVLSPVCLTKTHPGAQPLGWDGFSKMVLNTALPIYALGGLGLNDLPTALLNGAQGVAGIRGFKGGSV